jgi:hypothetical protein
VIISRDVIVDERVGSKPESEFEIDPVETPGEEPVNGKLLRAIQTPAKEAHKDLEPGGSGEAEKGAERRYPTRERKVPGEWFRANMAADAPKVFTGSTMEAKNGLEKGQVVDCVGVVDPGRGPTRPTSEAEKGLEKGPVVDRVSAFEPKREAAPEPQSYEEALAGADAELWRKAMDEEFASLLDNGTWELEKLPDAFKALPMK